MRYAANFNECSAFGKSLSWKDVIWLNAAKETNRELETKTALDIKYCLGQMTAMLQGFLGVKGDFKFASDRMNESDDTDESIDDIELIMTSLEKKFNG